ncbi:hypothetical protein BH10PSE6_BH10PSE6_48040 [soil metagenome]
MTFPTLLPPMPAQTLALSRYDVACRALAEAKAVDDIVEVVGQANAIHAYARQAKNRQMEIDAAELRIRAERRLGELMAAQKAKVGVAKPPPPAGRNGRVVAKPDHMPPTLSEAGIDKNLAHRARTYAAVPQETFEQLLTHKRQGENRRVVLDPDGQAATGDVERIAPAAGDGLAAGNDRLARLVRLVSELRRRLAGLIEENGALKIREKMWKERALAAGWTERKVGANEVKPPSPALSPYPPI